MQPSLNPSPSQPQYQLVYRQETITPSQIPKNPTNIAADTAQYQLNNRQNNQLNNQLNTQQQVVSSTLSFGGNTNDVSRNVVYGQNSVFGQNSAQTLAQTPSYFQRAQSRADNVSEDNSSPFPFPSFILNPRAASNSYLNRVTRTIPKIPGTRVINNVPIRQYQWPDYVDN